MTSGSAALTFVETGLERLVVVESIERVDERGSFIRTFDADQWHEEGLASRVVQCSLSRNTRRRTLRGMHYQELPHGEAKLVRCSRGAIFDVAVDLRRDSPTFRRWFGIELTESNGRMLHIPEQFAHGFLTLADDTEVAYQMSAIYAPDYARGVRWDDPAFGIEWPALPEVMSERDRQYPDFEW
jgi:dTDP-4-dehydrorhamnose 3,5-epimerase